MNFVDGLILLLKIRARHMVSNWYVSEWLNL